MAIKNTFHGKFMYYENINGKEKKVAKSFTDLKKFNDFTKKYPMPSLGSVFGRIAPSKKALPKATKDECCGGCCGSKKKTK